MRCSALVNGGQPDPVEPTLAVADGVVVVEPGRPALRFDVDEIRAEALAAAAARRVTRSTIEVGTTEIAPVTDDATAAGWADEVNAATEGPLQRACRSATTPSSTPRPFAAGWSSTTPSGEPTWSLDPDATIAALAERFPRNNAADAVSNPEIEVVERRAPRQRACGSGVLWARVRRRDRGGAARRRVRGAGAAHPLRRDRARDPRIGRHRRTRQRGHHPPRLLPEPGDEHPTLRRSDDRRDHRAGRVAVAEHLRRATRRSRRASSSPG